MAPKEANLANELDPSLNFIACDIMVCTHKESQLTRINVLYPNGCTVLVHHIITLRLTCDGPTTSWSLIYEIFHYKISLIPVIEGKYIYNIFIPTPS